MARDVIPLTGEDGKIVTDENSAKKDSEGISQPLDNGAVFASNMVICGGYSGTGYPADKSISNYDNIINMNRINLIVREGVTATDGGGKMNWTLMLLIVNSLRKVIHTELLLKE